MAIMHTRRRPFGCGGLLLLLLTPLASSAQTSQVSPQSEATSKLHLRPPFRAMTIRQMTSKAAAYIESQVFRAVISLPAISIETLASDLDPAANEIPT